MINIGNYFHNAGIDLTDIQIEQLNRYYELLTAKNKVMNLTAITEYDEVVIKHFCDSAAIIHAIDLKGIVSVIDVGTGAGFPGMVLKIIFPWLNVTLLDSLNKRIGFLNEVIHDLALSDIKAIHGRAEDYAHNEEYREKFDLCVSRAVANLASLSEYCIPFVKENGLFVSYKASDCDEEVSKARKAIATLGGNISGNKSYILPETEIERKFIIVEKSQKTSKKYPRKAGTPTKEPIL